MGKPVVVPSASKEEIPIASQEELLFTSKEESPFQLASKEESILFSSQEESQNKGSTPVVVVPTGIEFILPVVETIPPVVVPMEQNATVVNFSTPVVVVPNRKNK